MNCLQYIAREMDINMEDPWQTLSEFRQCFEKVKTLEDNNVVLIGFKHVGIYKQGKIYHWDSVGDCLIIDPIWKFSQTLTYYRRKNNECG